MLFSVIQQSVFGEILKLNNCCSFLNKISTITLVTRLHSLITSHYSPKLYLISGRNLSVGERAQHRHPGSVWSFLITGKILFFFLRNTKKNIVKYNVLINWIWWLYYSLDTQRWNKCGIYWESRAQSEQHKPADVDNSNKTYEHPTLIFILTLIFKATSLVLISHRRATVSLRPEPEDVAQISLRVRWWVQNWNRKSISDTVSLQCLKLIHTIQLVPFFSLFCLQNLLPELWSVEKPLMDKRLRVKSELYVL